MVQSEPRDSHPDRKGHGYIAGELAFHTGQTGSLEYHAEKVKGRCQVHNSKDRSR